MAFYYGADFYPEHWDESNWPGYAKLMQQAGFNTVRLAEFAWALMEPSAGDFQFDWLDRVLGVLYSQGISVVLGTPTAAMPAWVKEMYPDVLASSDGRHRDAWGVRKNNCFSSADYSRLSKSISLAMAEHFKDSPAVIGWQTDNEIDGPECRCSVCTEEFAIYLKDRYRTLNSLNGAWGTKFWGQVYSSWSQIQAPTRNCQDNPSLCLDWKRFHTWLQVRFQSEQIKIIRDICPNHFITHNYMGAGNRSNCYDLARDLDFSSFDSYPAFSDQGLTPDAFLATSFSCDLTRGLKGKNFWIMETTAGPTGWSEFSRAPRPGELRKTFYQHVSHGADGQLFFRWRTCTSGREQYWHGLLGHDGRPGRRYDEAKAIGGELAKIEDLIAGTTPVSDVAIIVDYDSLWATEIQPSFPGNDYFGNVRRYYDAFRRHGANVDIIEVNAEFSKYRVVAAPQLHVLPDEVAHRLNKFVESGGVLLADLRTAVKSPTNLCYERTLPGLLSDALGIEIHEYESVPGRYTIEGVSGFNGEFAAHQYADWIVPTTAHTMARYQESHVAEFSAATRNEFGSGIGYYLGTIVESREFYDTLVCMALTDGKVKGNMCVPDGIEVASRESNVKRLVFVINHTEQVRSIPLPYSMLDILTGTTMDGEATLEPFGVRIFA
jgi:beta-galactosidase